MAQVHFFKNMLGPSPLVHLTCLILYCVVPFQFDLGCDEIKVDVTFFSELPYAKIAFRIKIVRYT